MPGYFLLLFRLEVRLFYSFSSDILDQTFTGQGATSKKVAENSAAEQGVQFLQQFEAQRKPADREPPRKRAGCFVKNDS